MRLMRAFTNVLTRLSPFRITFVEALGQRDASLVLAPLYETMSERKKRTTKIVNLTNLQKYRGLPRFTAGEKNKRLRPKVWAKLMKKQIKCPTCTVNAFYPFDSSLSRGKSCLPFEQLKPRKQE